MKKIKKLKKFLKIYELDGYLIPKNDEHFNEYIFPARDRLKFISNFSGSAGFGLVTMKKNYLFVDGRYTLQAYKESGKFFEFERGDLDKREAKSSKDSSGFFSKPHWSRSKL